MARKKTYQENFIAGVKLLMANSGMDSLKDAADFLGLNYQALYKMMDRSNKPRAEHGITLCQKAGYSANWLFLDRGEVMYSDEIEKVNILEQIKALRSEVSSTKRR